MAADKKRREEARKKQEQEAVALKQKQLALEKKDAVEKARDDPYLHLGYILELPGALHQREADGGDTDAAGWPYEN